MVTGGVASRGTLLSLGATPRMIDRARSLHILQSVRRGIYASAQADLDQRRAIRLGGKVACLSALRRNRVWAGIDTRLHVCVRRSAHHLHVQEAASVGLPATSRRSDTNFVADPGAPRVHWQRSEHREFDESSYQRDWLMPPLTSLRQAVLCQNEEQAIASIDSALRTRFVAQGQVDRLFTQLPARLQHIRAEIDPTADSGNETIVRVRLRRAGFIVETQIPVPGTSQFDLLIDGVVTLDVDSRQWHGDEAQISWDFDKTLCSFGAGLPSLRILPRHIYQSWPQTLAVIRRTVADAKELREFRRMGSR
ncbi:hypothetical protein TZ00_11640 [Agreia bicolorata]|uniref:Very-short-patch-repair endonuclease n=2 Tax=Agreia bicolorata TaxID=110935 RepID=A0ABR5CEX7_9MICO|nr:hypothetical protein TZ00_11640 [Agreia bicolorata]